MSGYRSGRGRGSTSFAMPARVATRTRLVIVCLLLAALAASLIMGVPAMQKRANTGDFIISRMATECKDAFDISQTLSLTASSSSYEKLARIRSCVYGVEMLNNTYMVLEGRALIPENVFAELYGLIEAYNTQLITGMATASYVTDLQNGLDGLYNRVIALP